ncbi:MAG TPA: DNA polymerase III subunit chi [Caldimonas sp.]|nr:DNA polymerase III subunit chi [Caldimonas sp.]
MTEISFHFNVAAPVGYACRLVRKAARRGAGVVVTGPRPLLDELDREIWTFDAAEFVAHAWAEDSAAVPGSLHESLVWLATDPLAAPAHDALVNLGAESPRGYESFARLIEIVATAEPDRAAARERWKSYARRGYAIERHEVGE